MLVFEIILGLLILVFLVVIHELGHAIVARRNGVVVEEFGIGFPPRAWSKKLKNGILFTLNWLPLGGFVKLQGENDSASKKGDYGAASFGAKTRILLAGVLVNWLTAVVLLTILALFGMPKILEKQFTIASDTVTTTQPVELTAITKGRAAEKAGYSVGDKILRINGRYVTTTAQVIQSTKENKGKTVQIVSVRDGQQTTKQVTLGNDERGGIFGAGLGQRETIRATWSAPIVGVGTTLQFTWETFKGLGTLVKDFFTGIAYNLSFNADTREKGEASLERAGSQVAGPIGIFGTIFPAAERAGPTQVILLTAIISLTLAVMNVLPIPALDGGRWFVTALFKLLKKPLKKDLEEKIHGTGFMVLMVVVLLVTIADVKKLF